MSGQLYDLSNLQASFKALQADKAKAQMKTLEFVLELNKSVKIDEILIRQGYQIYEKKDQLEKAQKKKVFKDYKLFFEYMTGNIDTIEENYLKDSSDKEQIEQANKQDESQYNFLLNKNSISKFVRDQAHHYQNTIDKYLEPTGQDDQEGIKTTKMHSFFRDLFSNECTKIIKGQTSFLKLPEEEIAIHIGNTLISYAQESKDFTAEQASSQFSINQEQILDFLTFWLKKESGNGLFVLYARTTQRLEKESKILMNKSSLQVKMHPSRMSKDQIDLMEKEQEEAGYAVSQNSEAQSGQTVKQDEEKPTQKEEPKDRSSLSNNYSALSQLRSRQFGPVQPEKTIQQPPKELTKEEKLQKEMEKLFKFGCKRRYKVTKNNTFEELQFELTNMSLQKFISFCNFFNIQKLIDRILLIEYFKLFALNLRTLDYPRFQQIILKLVKTDARVIDHLLEKDKYEVKSKRNDIKHHKKVEGKLSNYKFKLRPVNGKDISTMEKDLTFRKLEKQIDREEKDQRALIKRERLDRTKSNVRSISNFGESRIDVSRFETIKEPSFNPERMISFDKDNDDLWSAYEAKIWKKQSKQVPTTLEEILSKRINRGTSIISKMNSQRSLLVE